MALGTAAVLSCTPLLAQSAQADDLDRKHDKVKHDITRAQRDLDEASGAVTRAQKRVEVSRRALASAEKELARTQSQLDAAVVRDALMQQRLQLARQRLADARAAVQHSRERIAQQRSVISQTAADNFAAGSPEMMELDAMLGSGTPADITAQVGAAQGVQDQQDAQLRDYVAAKRQLTREMLDVRDAEQQVATERAAAAAHLRHKVALQKAAAQQQQNVATTLKERRQAERAAQDAQAADQRRLNLLQRQESRIKRQILARARRQANQRMASTSAIMVPPVADSRITSPFGWRMHPIYHYWGLHNGDDFAVACGQPMQAVRGGRVVNEYFSPVWGNRLYLDVGKINGSNLTVVYNHISRYETSVGQRVSQGQTVALGGNSGWSTGCHLHFTVLKDGVPVDPQGYM